MLPARFIHADVEPKAEEAEGDIGEEGVDCIIIRAAAMSREEIPICDDLGDERAKPVTEAVVGFTDRSSSVL